MHTLKKLQPVFVLLFSFVALFVGVGYLVPPEQANRVQVVVTKDIDDVWPSLTNVEAWPQWWPQFTSVIRHADLHDLPTYQTKGEFGDVQLVVQRLQEPHSMVIYMEAGSFKGRWFFDLEICRAGTHLTITELGEVSNPLIRGLTVFEDRHASIRDFMLAFGALHEVRVLPDDVDVTVEEMHPKIPE